MIDILIIFGKGLVAIIGALAILMGIFWLLAFVIGLARWLYDIITHKFWKCPCPPSDLSEYLTWDEATSNVGVACLVIIILLLIFLIGLAFCGK